MEPISSHQFVFLSGSLPLDLIDTEVAVRGKRYDLLAAPDDAMTWWRLAAANHPDASLGEIVAGEAVQFLAALRALRTALRTMFSAIIDNQPMPPDAVAVLNRVLDSGWFQLSVSVAGSPRLERNVRDPGPDGRLFPIAWAAAELVTGGGLRRLHRCQNDRCVLLFYDETRSATRRWCSVACMDRARSRRRHRQQKAER